MKNQSFKLVMLATLLSIWTFSACNSDGSQTNSEQHDIDSTMDDISLHSASDMTGAEDYMDYSYNYIEEGYTEPEKKDESKAVDKSADRKKAPAKLKVKDMPVIYTVSQTDRPPLFTNDCLTAKDPQKCSNRALADWVKKNVKYPEADLAEGSDGLEYVTFVINKEGQVTSINRVESKQEACDGCSKAVLDAVLDMPDWQPAMLGGNPVNVVVTLPVRFKVL
ncbi:MAG: hypothetical protein GC192_00845 [Bacteroidetes bacterium]|nr:hypothetical protein [Bacteroidota bacterium]